MKLSEAQARIWNKSIPAEGNCRVWTGSRNDGGYGYLSFQGKTWKAHRASYVAFVGEIPTGLLVCHRCDNPPCVNPDHLFLGDYKANTRDMFRKGRARATITSAQTHFKKGRAPRGDEASGCRLSEADAREIIRRGAEGERSGQLAASFGVGRSTVQDLLRGSTWRHLDRPATIPRPTGVYARQALSTGSKTP